MNTSISVVLPTFKRERLLVDTIAALLPLLKEGDEILVIDQSLAHEAETDTALTIWAERQEIRWVRKTRPSQGEAMNAAAWLATGDILLFLDDDINPSLSLLDAHRDAHAKDPGLCGLRAGFTALERRSVAQVRNFELGFDTAYAKRAEVISLIGANFSMRRARYIEFGGMDENYRESNYRTTRNWPIASSTGHIGESHSCRKRASGICSRPAAIALSAPKIPGAVLAVQSAIIISPSVVFRLRRLRGTACGAW